MAHRKADHLQPLAQQAGFRLQLFDQLTLCPPSLASVQEEIDLTAVGGAHAFHLHQCHDGWLKLTGNNEQLAIVAQETGLAWQLVHASAMVRIRQWQPAYPSYVIQSGWFI